MWWLQPRQKDRVGGRVGRGAKEEAHMIGDAGGRTVLAKQMEDQWERCPGNQRVKGPGSSGRECLKR